jgi:T1SS-143 domain-containing protein
MTSENFVIANPGQGAAKSVLIPEGQQAVLGFEVSDISNLGMTPGGGLEIKLTNGGTLVIGNFQALADADIKIPLADGTPLEMDILMETLAGDEQTIITDNQENLLDPMILGRPSAETVHEVLTRPGQKYVLNFDILEPSEVSSEDGDLLIRFDNGGIILFRDFQDAESGGLPPALTLEDGSVISGAELITMIRLAKATPDEGLFEEIEEPSGNNLLKMASANRDLTEDPPVVESIENQIKENLDVSDIQQTEELNRLAQEFAETEPAGGEKMAEAAQQLARIEPAAGPAAAAPAAGRGGFGFQSDVNPVAIGPVDAIGPLGPTALQYGSPQFADQVFPLEEQGIDGEPGIAAPADVFMDETGLASGTLSESDSLTVDFGADGPGSVGPNGDFAAEGSLAGGKLSHQGVTVDVRLTMDGYEGYAGDIKVFDIFIDPKTGNYTFRLYEQLDHADGSDPNDLILLEFGVVASDSDGDTAETTITIGIQDDAPVVTPPPVADIDEDALAGGPVTVTGKVDNSLGQDLPGELEADGTYNISGDIPVSGLSSHGQAVTINSTAGGYEGVTGEGARVFDLVFTSPDGDYCFTLYEQLDHSAVGDVITLSFGVTATDYDSDTANTNIVIDIIDDIPVIGEPGIGAGIENVDETDLGPITVSGSVNSDFGADGPGTIETDDNFTAGGSLAGGNLQHNGVDISVTSTADGYIGMAGKVKVFELKITDQNTGDYEFTLFENIDHADGSNPDDVVKLNFGIVIRDFDGDAYSGNILINVADDAPCIADPVAAGVDESHINGTYAEATGTLVFDYGEDGAGDILITGNYSVSGEVKSGTLSSGGEAVNVNTTADGYEGITTGGAKIFDLVIDKSTGDYSFKLYGPLDHADPSDPDETIKLEFDIGIVDYDGDTDLTSITVNVDDDGPSICEPYLGSGIEKVDETSYDTDVALVSSGKLSVSFGEDGSSGVSAEGTWNSSSPLFSGGQSVTVTSTAAGYTGKLSDGTVVFDLTVDSQGNYTYTQYKTLDHPDASDGDDRISLNFAVTATDGDGDTAEGMITIKVDDDGVDAVADYAVAKETAGIYSDNLLANDDLSNDLDNTVTKISFGGNEVDVPGTGSVTIDGDYGTLEISADGSYTYTITDHNPPAASEVFEYRLVDGDGDYDTAQLTLCLEIIDDEPVITQPEKVRVDETNFDSDAVLTASGDIEADYGADGPGSISVNGNTSSSTTLFSNGAAVTIAAVAGGYIGETAAGTKVFDITIDGDGDYTFNQYETLDHPDTGNHDDTITLNFGFTATDDDGDTADGTVTVKIDDDGPVARDDYNEFDSNAGGTTGNVVTGLNADNAGAADDASNDNPNAVTKISYGATTLDVPETGTVSIDGQYGTLTIAADGSYTYDLFDHNIGNASHNFANDEVFPDLAETRALKWSQHDTLEVADGDFETEGPANVKVTFVNEFSAYSNTLGAYAVGADGSLQSVSFLIENGDAAVRGDSFSFDIPGGGLEQSFGFFMIADGYDVNHGYSGLDLVNGELNFVYNYGCGDERTAKITDDGDNISLVYTGPGGHETVIQGPVYHTTERGVGNDINSDDSMRVVSGLAENGDSTVLRVGFEDLPGLGDKDYNDIIFDVEVCLQCSSDQFEYTYTDGDGDTSTAILELCGKDLIDDIPVVGDDHQSVDETGLGPIVVAGDVSVDYGADIAGDVAVTAFDASGSLAGGTLTHQGEEVVVTATANGYYGTAVINGSSVNIFDFDLVDNEGGYEFRLYEQLDHADGSDPNDVVTLSFDITATDGDGDSSSGTVSIDIADDAPVANDDHKKLNVSERDNIDGNVLANDNFSEDIENTVCKIAFNGKEVVLGAYGATVNGEYGSLHIDADGSYNYDLFDGSTSGITDNFVYTLVDGDGDTSTANLKLETFEDDICTCIKVNNGVEATCVKEDGSVTVPVVAAYNGGNGNEVMTLVFTGVATGWDIDTGGWTYMGGGTYELTLAAGQDFYSGNITFEPPHDSDVDLNDLDFRAEVRDPDTGIVKSSNDELDIVVDAVIDQPDLQIEEISDTQYWYYKNRSYQVDLDIESSVGDTDGSEVITKIQIDLNQPFGGRHPFYTLEDMGIELNKGVEVSKGVWEITVNDGDASSALDGLKLVIPDDQNYGVIHQNKVGALTADIIVRSYAEEVALNGSECDYCDNQTVVVKSTSLTFRITPLVIDLDGNGVDIVSSEAGVMFDMNNNGTLDATSWVGENDGLLAMDINGDGVINNQDELFGNSELYSDGFANLASYDVNSDGVINTADDVFSDLLVWQDVNQDGYSQAGELKTLTAVDITSISLGYSDTFYEAGDSLVIAEGSYTFADGSKGAIADVVFNVVEGDEIGEGATLTGTDNNDILIGGEGRDTLFGGKGADVFLFDAIGEVDTVKDFDVSEGDVLDLNGLLENYDPVTDAINDFVYATESEGNTVVSVDTDGGGNVSEAVDVATLEGVTGVSVEELLAGNSSLAA